MRWIFYAAVVFWLANCARGPIRSVDQSMRQTKGFPSLHDDLEFSSLIDGLEKNVQYLREKAAPSTTFRFGPQVLSKDQYVASLEYLLAEAKKESSGIHFRKTLQDHFDAYEVYGLEDWGEVFITSYFEPVIEGSRQKTSRFSQALYGIPKDMVLVDLESFATARPSLKALQDKALEQRSRSNVLRGRLIPAGENGLSRITAYLSRSEITSMGLKEQSVVLAWVDPIDAFFLEIQGSGVVRFEDGVELNVGYAAQNGHPYVPIGRHLFHAIPKDKMSLQTIEAHLRSVSRVEARDVMNRNPSYVFFQILPSKGVTFLGTEVVAGRTIATDQTYFPKGSLAFLEFEKPVFQSQDQIEPVSWEKTSRFVLDQDTGGAIRGPHRVDLFWGRGPEAKQASGVMKQKGRLVYFVPRKELLARLAETRSPSSQD